MSYWTGFVQGFDADRRERVEQTRQDDDRRRQSEAKIFEHLMGSNDPEMRALALTGLLDSAQPGTNKGLGAYLGKLQSSKVFPQVMARMNEEMPQATAPGGGPSPPAPGGAAMSTNAPVSPGSAPVNVAPGGMMSETGLPEDVGAADQALMQPPPGPTAPQVAAPPPQVKSPLARRGTGVPTAQEIADYNAMAPMRARLQMAQQVFANDPATLARVQQAVFGATPAADTSANGPILAHPDDPQTPLPTIRHRDGSLTWADGTPVDGTQGYVGWIKPSSAGGGMTSVIRDSPEVRARYGIDASEVTPSGHWKIKQLPNGSAMVMPSEYTPPPAYSGTTVISDDQGIPVRAPIQRGGGLGAPLGDAPGQVESKEQTDAKALKAAVDKALEDAKMGGIPVPAGQRDQTVAREAQRFGLPYTTYYDLEAAIRTTPPVTPRQRLGDTRSPAEKVRQRMEENRRGGVGAPPPKAPVRQGGPGPNGAR